VSYQAAGASSAATVNVNRLKVEDFDFDSAFKVAVTFARLSDKQNFDLSGPLGRCRKNGVLDRSMRSRSRPRPASARSYFTIEGAHRCSRKSIKAHDFRFRSVSEAAADGTWIAQVQRVEHLSAAAIAFGDSFNKPAGVPLKISAEGSRVVGRQRGAPKRDARRPRDESDDIKVGGGTTSARVDTNRFDLASLAKVSRAAKSVSDGKSEIHSNVIIRAATVSRTARDPRRMSGCPQPDQRRHQ